MDHMLFKFLIHDRGQKQRRRNAMTFNIYWSFWFSSHYCVHHKHHSLFLNDPYRCAWLFHFNFSLRRVEKSCVCGGRDFQLVSGSLYFSYMRSCAFWPFPSFSATQTGTNTKRSNREMAHSSKWLLFLITIQCNAMCGVTDLFRTLTQTHSRTCAYSTQIYWWLCFIPYWLQT